MGRGYLFYDSKYAVSAGELQELYRFTKWGRSRSLEEIERMLDGTSMCFSIRKDDKMVAFCRLLTDFVFRGSIWDIMV
ncbi:MAG TPA: N-acetyltransferase, partial [Synergistaceae bacterium]|nr:N-acetyltransferase [Synergistaceae bacterium]